MGWAPNLIFSTDLKDFRIPDIIKFLLLHGQKHQGYVVGLSDKGNLQGAVEGDCAQSVLVRPLPHSPFLVKPFDLSEGLFPHLQNDKTTSARRLNKRALYALPNAWFTLYTICRNNAHSSPYFP